MGWSGAGLFAELIHTVQKNVPDDDSRREIYEHMWDSFSELDWDDQEECLGVDQVYDDLYRERRPVEEMEAYEDEDLRGEL